MARFRGNYRHKSIVAPLQAAQDKAKAAQDKAIQKKINEAILNPKDPRFLTKAGKNLRLKLARELGHVSALKYTTMIKEKFDELGVSYLPFMLEYIETEKKVNVFGGKIKVPKHNFTLSIDHTFVRSVNSRKISFHTWLIRKNPELGRRYHREVIKGLSANEKYKSTPQWGRGGKLWKQFQREGPEEDREISQMDHVAEAKPRKGYVNGKFVIASMSSQKHVNDTTYKKQPIPPSHHMKPNQIHGAGDRMNVATHEIDKFIENEQYIFGGNLNKFLTSKKGTAEYKIINDILSDVLGQFKADLEALSKTFVEKDYEKLANVEGIEKNKKGIAPKFKQDTKTKSKWKVKPKFPNIESILWWFLNDQGGMASSTKLEQYNNLKTVKAKSNWIDRSIFLIANGVYAKKLGHKRGLTPTGRQKKFGKAARITHAQKFKRDSEDAKRVALKPYTERVRKYSDWRKITSTAARGMKKRKNNPSSRKDNRKDNR
jgi:hypothetical protein